jgi:hypothetical protein
MSQSLVWWSSIASRYRRIKSLFSCADTRVASSLALAPARYSADSVGRKRSGTTVAPAHGRLRG